MAGDTISFWVTVGQNPPQNLQLQFDGLFSLAHFIGTLRI
jgi:hypothetical protein